MPKKDTKTSLSKKKMQDQKDSVNIDVDATWYDSVETLMTIVHVVFGKRTLTFFELDELADAQNKVFAHDVTFNGETFAYAEADYQNQYLLFSFYDRRRPRDNQKPVAEYKVDIYGSKRLSLDIQRTN